MADLVQRLTEVLAHADIVAAYLFGSRADGTNRDDSDVDVAVLVGRDMELMDELRLVALLERAAGVPVDVVVLDHAPLELRGRVVQDGRVLVGAQRAERVVFEGRTRAEYFDYLPTLRAHTQRYLRQTAARAR